MKKERKLEKKVLGAVEKVARNEITRNLDGRLPFCMGIFHQPKRPKRKEN